MHIATAIGGGQNLLDRIRLSGKLEVQAAFLVLLSGTASFAGFCLLGAGSLHRQRRRTRS